MFFQQTHNRIPQDGLLDPRFVQQINMSTIRNLPTVKRLRQLENEKEMLFQGLEIVEKARLWYIRNINEVSNRMKLIGLEDIENGDLSLDANQDRINCQAARISTVNQHLASLMDQSRSFPVYMNIPVRSHQHSGSSISSPKSMDSNRQALNSATIQRLKDQNRMLTEEVGMKSEKINALEREKSVLIRELFQNQSTAEEKFSSKEATDDNSFV